MKKMKGASSMEYSAERGLSLLKKGKKGLVRVVFSRAGIVTILLLLQMFFLGVLGFRFSEYIPHVFGSSVLISFTMALVMINSKMEPSSIIMWLMIMILMPVFGMLLFWYTKSELGHRALKGRLNQILKETSGKIVQNQEVLDSLKQDSPDTASLANYLYSCGSFPVYRDTQTRYFSSGEQKFEALLKEL